MFHFPLLLLLFFSGKTFIVMFFSQSIPLEMAQSSAHIIIFVSFVQLVQKEQVWSGIWCKEVNVMCCDVIWFKGLLEGIGGVVVSLWLISVITEGNGIYFLLQIFTDNPRERFQRFWRVQLRKIDIHLMPSHWVIILLWTRDALCACVCLCVCVCVCFIMWYW